MKTVFIYALKDPKSNQIRYIGKTLNLKKRLYSHINEAKKPNGRRYVLNWIKSLLDTGSKPIITEIEKCFEHNWQEREKYWIEYYRKIVPNLCNNADGGLGGSGVKNYTTIEIEERRKIASKNFSKHTQSEKQTIWSIIKDKSFKDVSHLVTKNVYFQVKNGYVWNDITKLPKPVKKHTTIRDKNSGLKLTEEQILFIKNSRKKITQKTLAEKFNISQATIWLIQTKWK